MSGEGGNGNFTRPITYTDLDGLTLVGTIPEITGVSGGNSDTTGNFTTTDDPGCAPPLSDADREAGYEYRILIWDLHTRVRVRNVDGIDEIHPDDEALYRDAKDSFYRNAFRDALLLGVGKITQAIKVIAPGSSNAAKVAVDANKLNHIFDKEAHNLGGFLAKYGGNQEKAFSALQNAAQQHVNAKGITGIFEEIVKVNGTDIVVRGKVVDGVVKVGTAFIP